MSEVDNQSSDAPASVAPTVAAVVPSQGPASSSSSSSSSLQTLSQSTLSTSTTTNSQSVPPSDHVYQLILEQFWGDGVSKREIRSVYTTAADANAACHDYLLWTWPRDQFSLYELGQSPQRPELAKVSAQIHGDRFHVWIERHSWQGILDFSSHAIARRTGRGPNAYIVQRTIKDASGGKRRSTTRGIYATRQLAKQALAQDEPPAEWSSNQGYVLETGGEYAHATSPSGKTAWLFIEVRPLFMTYRRLEQEEQDKAMSGTSAQHPISLDHGDDNGHVSSSSVPPSPSTLLHGHSMNPFSPMASNPDEAGAFVFLVLQLKTLPYTPPILTVEAVAYELDVANRLGIGLLEAFNGPTQLAEPVFREDGCLQGTVEQRGREEGLTVWVEKRVVVVGDEALDYDLLSEHGSVASARMQPLQPHDSMAGTVVGAGSNNTESSGARKREEPQDGFESADKQGQIKAARLSPSVPTAEGMAAGAVNSKGPFNVVTVTRGTQESQRTVVFTTEDKEEAMAHARMNFYQAIASDVSALNIKDTLSETKGSLQATRKADSTQVNKDTRRSSMTAIKVAESLGRMFYLVSPKATTFATVAEVPTYVSDTTPWFIVFVLAELLYYFFKDNGAGLKQHEGKYSQARYRLNDTIGSLSAGVTQQLSRFFFGHLQMVTYIFIWDNYRIESIAFDTFKLSTWIGCFLATDFAYYWLHRAGHEVNILWAGHSVHHSSEMYNASTALRQSVAQSYTTFIFNLPLALVFSPSQFAVHSQFNLLFQFWIHTGTAKVKQIIPYMGWLEYVINTPSAHRLHHDDEEPVSFGLTHPVNTFDPLQIQFGHFHHIFKTVLSTPGFTNKLKVVFYGPGWHEGVPRTGLLSEIPEVDIKNPPIKYDPILPRRFNYYIAFHFLIVSAVSSPLLAGGYKVLPLWQTQLISLAILSSFVCLSKVMDAKSYGLKAELFRCLVVFFLAEFVARSGRYEQTYWQRRGTLVVADTFAISSAFLGWNIYKFGKNWTSLTAVSAKEEKVKLN
ncbi:hypothetical protein BG004_004901 [Podila humilis]|nr:hypothetical protein BG004_004901 [Podila humilis]